MKVYVVSKFNWINQNCVLGIFSSRWRARCHARAVGDGAVYTSFDVDDHVAFKKAALSLQKRDAPFIGRVPHWAVRW